jgi:mutator protein MutT
MKRVDVDIAIITRGGKVLICQRKSDNTFGGCWEFPGGKREPGETAEQCLRRELDEELAVRARPIEALDVIEHDYPAARVRLHPYLCEHTAGEPQLLACQQAIWVDPPALRDYPFPPANEGLIEQAIERLTRSSGGAGGGTGGGGRR